MNPNFYTLRLPGRSFASAQLRFWAGCISSLILAALLAASTHAGVTNVVWYRLGENDPGAASGLPVTNTTTDVMGFENLKQIGGPLYTNDVSTSAVSHVGSSLSVQFNGTNQFLSNSVVSTATANFGIEAWVRPSVVGDPNADFVLAYNGNPNLNGWGLRLSGSSYSGLLGGVANVGSATAVAGVWTHLALVCSSGTTTFYVNGAAIATSFSSPNSPTGTGFEIGAAVNSASSQTFKGAIDEVRVFTSGDGFINPIQFSTDDLLINIQRVTTQLPSIGSTSATLFGSAYPPGLPTTAWFEWGTTTNYGNTTASLLFPANGGATNFSQNISGLVTNVNYHYRTVVSNRLGLAYGADQAFGTPFTATLPATGVGALFATLNGIASPGGVHGTVGYFQYGPTTNYTSSTSPQSLDGPPGIPASYVSTNFSQTVTNLSGGTTYHYRAVSSANGNALNGGDLTFTTPIAPVVTTLPASGVGVTTATLNATGNPEGLPTVAWFEWGTTVLGMNVLTNITASQDLGSNTGTVGYSQPLTGLTPGVTYYYHGVVSNAAGTVVGTTQNFTMPLPPTVTTGPANFSGGTVPLNGTANPNGTNTTAWFEWGTTTNYGNVTAPQALGAGLVNTNFSQVITGLTAGVYQYHAVASNVFGVAIGANQSFTAPTFYLVTDLVVTNLTGVYTNIGSVSWGDYDNDGLLDILIAGEKTSKAATEVWRNTGNGFTNAFSLSAGGRAAWGDYDNDGLLDFATTDKGPWRNTGNGFTNIPVLPSFESASLAWGDYDNDGRPDLLMTGTPPFFGQTAIFRNTIAGFTNINAGFAGIFEGSAVWGDYDNDGRLDVLLTGNTSDILIADPITQVLRNTGNGFTNINAGLSPVYFSSVAWGDYDNDGLLDVLLTGGVSEIWRNTGNGFTNSNVALPSLANGSVAWGDFDNDGRLDILLTGNGPSGAIAQIWQNTGSGFTNVSGQPGMANFLGLPGVMNSSVAWGDYDNDGRLDFLLAGQTSSGQTVCQIWRNNMPITNTPPSAPTNLSATVSGSSMHLNWAPASDAQTPAGGLSYNLRIGTTPGGFDVMAPMSASNGLRRIAQFGMRRQQGAIFNYTSGTTYYWSVQAVDTALAGSPFAAEQTFTAPLLPLVTTLPASEVGLTNATLNGSANPEGLPTIGWFEWGTNALDNVTSYEDLGRDTNSANYSQPLTDLIPGVTYFYHSVISNAVGVLVGSTQSFTMFLPPTATTTPADVPGATVTLNGAADPNGTNTFAWFQWGTTTDYGNLTALQALGAGFSSTNFSQLLTGLTAGVYQYRSVVSNVFGVVFGTNQSFTVPMFYLVTNLTGVFDFSGGWGDYNNDGRLDLAISGKPYIQQTTNDSDPRFLSQIWRNTDNGFVLETNIANEVQFVEWRDYNKDGNLDLVANTGGAGIFLNTGSGFTNLLELANSEWRGMVDFDNDGLLDAFGYASSAAIWRNTGSGFTNINASLSPNLSYFRFAWGDFDNDGRPDLLLTTDGFAKVFRNTGNSFTNIGLFLPAHGSVDWGDYDNDGLLDILVTGFGTNGQVVAQVWRNTGNGFTNINAGLTGVWAGSAVWGDYDNDGRLDILLTGGTSVSNGYPSEFVTQIWRNTGNGFTNINANLPAVGFLSGALWGDYDGDGRLDILLTGVDTNNELISQIWRNNMPATNTPPLAPSGLTVALSNDTVVLGWMPGSDAQTPASGLSYNLRIGTTPGGFDVISPMSASNGFRRVVEPGMQRQGGALFKYTPGTPYYWSVQAIDTSFAGSPFAPEQSFKILQPPVALVPVTATNLVPGDTNGDGILDQNEFAALLALLNGNGIVNDSELNIVLFNYFAHSPWLYMTNVAGLGGSNVTFALSNSIAGTFNVEYSTNLINWQLLGPATPRYLFTDTNAAGPQRFYRLRLP
jgi:hypothetical protein